MPISRYETYRALHQAVKSAAKASERDTGRAVESFFSDRFLCRIYSDQEEHEPMFVLKGGQRLLAVNPIVRETHDIDFDVRGADFDEALEELKTRASLDLDDHLAFYYKDFHPNGITQIGREGFHVIFETRLGQTEKSGSDISIDLIFDEYVEPADFRTVEPIHRLQIKGLQLYPYIISPSEQQASEKICAIMQPFSGNYSSSRIKDLVDLTTSILAESFNGEKLRSAVESENCRHDMAQIDAFTIPVNWQSAVYKKLATEASLPPEYSDMHRAEAAIRSWLAPVLNGDADGLTWDPKDQLWS